jgi:hypothetical protein
VAAIAGLLLAPITFVHANMGFIGLKAFRPPVVGGFGSLPGAIVGGLVIGMVESLSGFYLPEGFKDIAAYIVVLLMLMVKPNGLFGESCERRSDHRMRFIFKTSYEQDIRLAKHGGHVFWYGLLVLAWWRALAAARILAGAADLHPDLRHRRPGADAAGGLHRAVLAGPRGLSGRGRLHAGRAGRRLAVSAGLACAAVLAAVGVVVGLPALRVKGIYLGMATLAFGFIVEEVFARWDSVTGGNAGKRRACSSRQSFLLRVPAIACWPRWACSTCCARPPAAPSSPSATPRSRRRAWASTWRATRRCLSRCRPRWPAWRRAVRAQAAVHLARPVHPAVHRPAADDRDRRPGLGARRLPGRDVPDLDAAADRLGKDYLPEAIGQAPGLQAWSTAWC